MGGGEGKEGALLPLQVIGWGALPPYIIPPSCTYTMDVDSACLCMIASYRMMRACIMYHRLCGK